MVTQKTDYKAELEKLPPEEREQYIGSWRDYLQKLPRQAYVGQLTNLSRQFGPEFASRLISPELAPTEVEPAPIEEVPAKQLITEKETPWYLKPLEAAQKNPLLQPIFKGLERYQKGWIAPAAMTIAQPFAPKLREQLEGRSPWAIPKEERAEIWEESGLPWLTKTGLELAVDPSMYFGWGLGTKAVTGLEKAGYKGLAKAVKPIASAEEAFIRAAAVPIRAAGKQLQKLPAITPDIAELRATGKLVFKKPLEESARSIVNNLPTHTYDALHSLGQAAEIKGKTFSQVLEDFRMGIPDNELLATITNPNQRRALEYISKNADKLDLDTLIRIADKHPDTAASVIGWKQVGLVAKELGLPAPRLSTGITGSVQKMANKMYSLWKRTVLQTPYYVLQNTVENPIREIMVGVRPLWDITDYAKMTTLAEHPVDIQRRIVSLSDRWNKTMPEHLASPFARTPATGGITEAVTGAVAVGKSMPASTVAAYMDDTAIVNTYFNWYDKYVKAMMETGSPQTREALAKISGLYDEAIHKGTLPENVFFHSSASKSLVLESKPLFASKDISEAKAYAKNLYKVELTIDKPATIDDIQLVANELNLTQDFIERISDGTFLYDHPEVINKLKTKGFDGIRDITDISPNDSIEWATTSVVFDASKQVKVSVSDIMVEPKLLEHLKQVSTSGSVDDVLNAFQEVQRNKTLTIARAMNNLEKGLPSVVQSKIKTELPRLWAKNDIQGIHRLFEELQRTMPQKIESYQKQVMVQRLKSYRDLLRTSVPVKYRPFVTKVLNSFKLDRVSEAESRIASSKSLSEFQQAMFKASLESRRELEALMEGTMITEAIAKNVDDKALEAWYQISQQVNQRAFKMGEELVDRTFQTANTIRFAKDPSKIKQGWDAYIMEIQSEFPEITESLRAITTPDTDSLWSAYRAMQERRWFNVGQEKLRAMGVDFSQFPRVIGADGKLLTQEDFLKSQLSALKGWEDRVIGAWDKRHIEPTAKNKLLDTLRSETIAAKESVALQEKQLQNKARDLALDVTYSTFGNYAQRTNLDDFMMGIGVPFWFFPSRSIPFYTTQMIQRPRLGVEVLNLQNESETSEQPSRLFGTIQIPGTNYWYNPLQSTMLWQLADRRNFVPPAMGGLEQGQNWMRNNLGVSLGPQWHIATAIVERMMGKQAGETTGLGMEPQPIIPQQRWLEAVAGLKLPVVSPIAGLLNEPFDMYLRAVYGDNVAEWSKREVEKTIVDMGENPQTASDEVIQAAWNKYYTRQLLSIPAGAVKEMTPTEMARFEAINQKAKELDLTQKERVTLRQLGESPFVGLRQDQLEAVYKDIPAQKLWRYIRPSGLTSKSRPIWEDYIDFRLGREALLYGEDKDNPTEGSRLWWEQSYDKALQSGRISPREWKSLYRNNYANYISKVEQLAKDTPLSPKTDADWEAYRELLGWKEPIRHPDDIKLDEYYDVMDSSKFENDLGEFDYDAYRKTEVQFLQGLSPDTVTYIKSRKDKYKTPLRAAYGRDMEKVQPYYDLQGAILAQYPPEIAQVIEYALASPDIAIQRAILINYPSAMIALRRVRIAKEQLRLRNPELDHILRYWSS